MNERYLARVDEAIEHGMEFIKVPGAIARIHPKVLPIGAKYLCGILLWVAYNTQDCKVTDEQLMAWLGVARNTLRGWLRELENLELIICTKRGARGGEVSTYRLVWDAPKVHVQHTRGQKLNAQGLRADPWGGDQGSRTDPLKEGGLKKGNESGSASGAHPSAQDQVVHAMNCSGIEHARPLVEAYLKGVEMPSFPGLPARRSERSVGDVLGHMDELVSAKKVKSPQAVLIHRLKDGLPGSGSRDVLLRAEEITANWREATSFRPAGRAS